MYFVSNVPFEERQESPHVAVLQSRRTLCYHTDYGTS
jgi:hypothetical protein